MKLPKIVGIIPARYHSSRFPGKPLALLEGKPLIAHVVDQARQVSLLERIIVATDDLRIQEAAVSFGAESILTSSEHPTGTDRIAEVARHLEADWIVNLQGDEPLLDPGTVEEMLGRILTDKSVQVATGMTRVQPQEQSDINAVKVVANELGDVLCFSRVQIPAQRYPERSAASFKQLGLYGFRPSALRSFSAWPPSPLEQTESVELYRFLENGWKVRAVELDSAAISVDTPEDLERVRVQIQSQQGAISRG